MAELKGQLLGVLLVVIIFGVLAASFQKMMSDTTGIVESRISEVIENISE